MRIQDCYSQKRPVISFEIFPPKKDDEFENIGAVIAPLAALNPDYISVTCGAGGAGRVDKTAQLAAQVQSCGAPALAHLTCIGATKAQLTVQLDELRAKGIHNILALRGDIPAGEAACGDYAFASELIRDIKAQGVFCAGAACYPEGHIACDDLSLDMMHLKEKQDAGADFLITQLFFDNDVFLRFWERARAAGITLPISAGVMPILGRAQIERMIFMCGASLPSNIIRLLHKYEHDPASLRQAGIEHAALQVAALVAHGVDGVHIYTMNKPDIAAHCVKGL